MRGFLHRSFDEQCGPAPRKLLEEAGELMDARDSAEAEWEMADLLYFASVRLNQAGGRLEGTIRELVRRSLKLSRRPGDAKRALGAG